MLLAVLQGASELFPVSSLGHTVLIPAMLRWSFDRSDPTFLAFVVALHLGTAIALVAFYRSDWARIASARARSVVRGSLSNDADERIGWLLVVGTVPVAMLGVFLEKPVRQFFGSSAMVAGFLILNAFVMFGGEALRRRALSSGAASASVARPLAALPWLKRGEPTRKIRRARGCLERRSAGRAPSRAIGGSWCCPRTGPRSPATSVSSSPNWTGVSAASRSSTRNG